MFFLSSEAVQPLRHMQLQREPQFRGEGHLGGRDGASSSSRLDSLDSLDALDRISGL